MEHIKSYKLFESIRDKMEPKSDEEVKDLFSKLKRDDKLIIASRTGMFDKVKKLIKKHKHRFNPMAITLSMESSLLNDNSDIFKLLMTKFNINDDLYNNLFRGAVDKGRYEIVEFLLDSGKIDLHFNNEWAMRCAIIKGFSDILKLLLDRGADISKVDVKMAHQNISPMKIAKKNGYKRIINIINKEKSRNLIYTTYETFVTI